MENAQLVRRRVLIEVGAAFVAEMRESGKPAPARGTEAAAYAAIEYDLALPKGSCMAIVAGRTHFTPEKFADIRAEVIERDLDVPTNWESSFQSPAVAETISLDSLLESEVTMPNDDLRRANPKKAPNQPKDRRTSAGRTEVDIWESESPTDVDGYRGGLGSYANPKISTDDFLTSRPDWVEEFGIPSDHRWARRAALESIFHLVQSQRRKQKLKSQLYDSDKAAELFGEICAELFPGIYKRYDIKCGFVPRFISGQFHFTQKQIDEIAKKIGVRPTDEVLAPLLDTPKWKPLVEAAT